jgi:uncharacterized GH25 family protein
MFWRCAKSLLLAGAADPQHGDRPLGFPLELVAERNPYALATGESLPVRLTFRGQPLAGALVQALRRGTRAPAIAVRTDREGRVTLPLPDAGMWLVKAVHTLPAAAGADAEWASYWASLTFERRGSQP